jgi:3-hydroxybutyryl-CoA dehydrogenase
MKLAIVANEQLKEELISISFKEDVQIDWLNSITELAKYQHADAVIDLLFDPEKSDTTLLKEFHPRPVIINSVLKTLPDIDLSFIRINGWSTFLKRPVTEAAFAIEADKVAGEKIFEALGRKMEWVPDVPGFLSPRVIAMIINEAYFTLEENVSTKEEIDIAMKLGTNYPFGPFEWAQMIGLKNIYDLLNMLSIKEKRYQPGSLLIKEALEK